ncbi:hypothetical protein ABAC460_02180 [Asticcacaulis sp. AC460]|nr:hypothetical protein ABAC460_02180 [Asticcacaulis sp. AC460]
MLTSSVFTTLDSERALALRAVAAAWAFAT